MSMVVSLTSSIGESTRSSLFSSCIILTTYRLCRHFFCFTSFPSIISLHTIPCIGIKAKCGGKTFTYSADTHMNPELVQKMFNDGAIGEGRKDALLNFPWDADLILHEAGVPPIHTPIDILSALSPEIKSRLYLVHVTPRTVPEKSGLQVASAGQTLRLDVVESEHQAAVQALNLFRRISILSPLFTPGTLVCLKLLCVYV